MKKDIYSRENVKRWADWSLTSHTEDEIREKMLIDPDSVCFIFVFENSNISKEFENELRILSINDPKTNKPFIDINNYNKLYRDLEQLYLNVKYDSSIPTKKKIRKIVIDINELKQRYDRSVMLYNRYLSNSDISLKTITRTKQSIERNKEILNDAQIFIETGKYNKNSSFFKILDNILNDRIPNKSVEQESLP